MAPYRSHPPFHLTHRLDVGHTGLPVATDASRVNSARRSPSYALRCNFTAQLPNPAPQSLAGPSSGPSWP
eukprot:262684-Pyramimonas_sp.AAC.1